MFSGRLIAFLIFYFIVGTAGVFAGRPLVIDDAPPVGPGQLELELGLSHSLPNEGGREQRWPVMAWTYGLGKGWEVGLAVHRVNSDLKGDPPGKGFEDLHLATKYNFLGEGVYLPALAFSVDVKIPTANRHKGLSTGRADENLLLIATKRFSTVALDLNAGYLIVNSPSEEKLKNRFSTGLALRWELDTQWGLVGELHGQSRKARGERNEAHFQVGVKYLLTDPLVFDAAVGRSLRPSGTSIQATLGLTWTFAVNF